MGWKSFIIKPYAKYIARQVRKVSARPVESQQKTFRQLVRMGRKTVFGRDHQFSEIQSHKDFVKYVPLRDYEELKPYIDRMIQGERDVLWPGMPKYVAKTSGTTSGSKYIPLTKDSIPNHMDSARNALMMYIDEIDSARVFDGKIIFISGSPKLEKKGAVHTGRLSGIVNYHVPKYAKMSQLPGYETNRIEDFEEKLDRIVDETIDEDMRLISGIPPWVLMYFEKLIERTGKPIIEIFPNFEVFVHGGVNFEPYRARFMDVIGREIHIIETYPASEGFIAYTDSQQVPGLLLNVDSGIFFEFVPSGEIFEKRPTRLGLQDIELDTNYALVINNNAGLWGYILGDTVKFVSRDPYRLVVTGRTRHFISAFGEHVIAEEVEQSLLTAAGKMGTDIVEFTVAPQINPPQGELPYHEWFVEFSGAPSNPGQLVKEVDTNLQKRNPYYEDLIKGAVLQPLKLRVLGKNAFRKFMKAQGRLGGQNKVPRLSNDRKIADEIQKFILRE